MNWQDARILVLDTETTGVDKENDRIVELGGYAFHGLGNLDDGERLGMLINPGVPIPKEASDVHGITDDAVADAPRFESVAWRLLERVKRAEVLVAYNWAFDSEMIAAELDRIDSEQEGEPGDLYGKWEALVADRHVLDPLVIVRMDKVGRYWRGKGRHKLDAVAQRLSIRRSGDAHRASSDAELAARVLKALARHVPAGAAEAAWLVGEEQKKQEAAFQAWLASKEAS